MLEAFKVVRRGITPTHSNLYKYCHKPRHKQQLAYTVD